MKFLNLVAVLAACASMNAALAQGNPAAFTPHSTYESTFFITPNGDPNFVGPMVKKMLSANVPGVFGGGQFTKVGLSIAMFYTTATEGAKPYENGAGNYDYQYYVNRGPIWHALPLPPDVLNLSELPAEVRDGLDGVNGTADDAPHWMSLAKVPRVIAALEWARYLNLPLSIQMQATGPYGGVRDPLTGSEGLTQFSPTTNIDLDLYVESLGASHCMLDHLDRADPDGDPATFDSADLSFVTIDEGQPSWAQPSFVDATYLQYLQRNVQSSISQLIAYAALPRYAGRLLAIALDPEMHYGSFKIMDPATQTEYPAVLDYNAKMISGTTPGVLGGFQKFCADKYGDVSPLTDSNQDGKTFWRELGGEYMASGTATHDHSVAVTDWNQIDPPRNPPRTTAEPRTRYWHLWTEYRVDVLKKFLNDYVGWCVDAGMPANRVFAHQASANASFWPWRATHDNEEWCDEWSQVSPSKGRSGISIYQSRDVITQQNRYGILGSRDDAWGSPEYNPYVTGSDIVTGYAVVESDPDKLNAAVDETWSTNAHVLWAHHWGDVTAPVFDCTSWRWVRNEATENFVNPLSPSEVWTSANMVPFADRLCSYAQPCLIQSPTVAINADEAKFLSIKMNNDARFTQEAYGLVPMSTAVLQVDFRKNGVWYTDASTTFRIDLSIPATQSTPEVPPANAAWNVVDLSNNPNWSGTVTGLRIYPAPQVGNCINFEELIVSRDNPFTVRMRELMQSKKDDDRNVVSDPVLNPTFPFVVGPALATIPGSNLKIYETSPLFADDTEDFNDEHTDFGQAGNFFREQTATAGGAVMDAVVQPPSTFLGLKKTARLRRVQLPSNNPVTLKFNVGLLDDVAVADGAQFRVLVRDASLALTEISSVIWRKNEWSSEIRVDLDAWMGQSIDIYFEVNDLLVHSGELAAWGNLRFERRFYLTTSSFPSYGGTTTPVGPQEFYEGITVWVIANPTPATSYTFTEWTVTSGVPGPFFNATSAATQVTMNSDISLTANFRIVAVFESQSNRDGWILETSENGNAGGTTNTSANGSFALRIGDDGADKQYRSILSFATSSLPDNATLTNVTLAMTRGTTVGAPSATSHGAIELDIVPGFFGNAVSLDPQDFQSAPTGLVTAAGILPFPLTDNSETVGVIGATGLAAVSLTSTTQIRVRFQTDDNDNNVEDRLGFFSGDSTPASVRPKLTVFYYVNP